MAYFNTLIKFKKEAAMAKPSQNHAQKLSTFVKQNSAANSSGPRIETKNKWQRRDLNPRPKAYESSALPLSYAAINIYISRTKSGCQSLFCIPNSTDNHLNSTSFFYDMDSGSFKGGINPLAAFQIQLLG